MQNTSSRSTQTSLFVLWVLVNIVGWSASHTILRLPSLQIADEILPLIAAFVLDGMLVGVIVGAGQWLILKRTFPQLSGWIQITALTYSVGLLVSLPAEILWLYQMGTSQGLPMLAEEATTTMLPSPPLMLVATGAIVGVAQWRKLRSHLAPTFRNAALWVVGTMAGLGVGWFVVGNRFENIEALQGVSNILSGVIMGLVNGSITGGVLLILLNETKRIAATEVKGLTGV
ncbi:MAG TPA: hypothetical protein VJ020_12960 [Anaerolineales bacterium]|nr:hypothetical protein [Anaerolineales bacterium]